MDCNQYVIEKLAQENARMTVELNKANFTILALQEKLENKETENNESEKMEEEQC